MSRRVAVPLASAFQASAEASLRSYGGKEAREMSRAKTVDACSPPSLNSSVAAPCIGGGPSPFVATVAAAARAMALRTVTEEERRAARVAARAGLG